MQCVQERLIEERDELQAALSRAQQQVATADQARAQAEAAADARSAACAELQERVQETGRAYARLERVRQAELSRVCLLACCN